MSIRDEAIESTAKAIAGICGWPHDAWDDPEAYNTLPTAKEAYTAFASVAFDAIIERLKAPDEAVIAAGEEVINYHPDDIIRNQADAVWQAMLSMITPTKAEREGE